jgi:dephospho-CoA kinase
VKILIIGHARHGKDTVASFIKEEFGLTHMSSSEAALQLFAYDLLRDKYGYQSKEECFKDRLNHRSEWYDMICEYNSKDQSRLAKDLLGMVDIYVGMRSDEELSECIENDLFGHIIAVYDPRKELEPESSMLIDIHKRASHIILNDGTLGELKERTTSLFKKILKNG